MTDSHAARATPGRAGVRKITQAKVRTLLKVDRPAGAAARAEEFLGWERATIDALVADGLVRRLLVKGIDARVILTPRGAEVVSKYRWPPAATRRRA